MRIINKQKKKEEKRIAHTHNTFGCLCSISRHNTGGQINYKTIYFIMRILNGAEHRLMMICD